MLLLFTSLQPALVRMAGRGGSDGAGCGGGGGGGGDGDGGHEDGSDGDGGWQRAMRLLALVASAALQQAISAGAAFAKRSLPASWEQWRQYLQLTLRPITAKILVLGMHHCEPRCWVCLLYCHLHRT